MSDRTCSLVDCDRKHLARGYCKPHYRAWDRWGDPRGGRGRPIHLDWTRTDAKPCSKCDEVKSLDEFPLQPRGFLGRMAWCSVCRGAFQREFQNRPEQKRKAAERAARPDSLRRQRDNAVARRWGARGVAIEERRRRGDGCDACGRVLPRMALDHDHATDAARGLLCNPCNLILGYAEDDPARLLALVEYLAEHATRLPA